jgi:hypothetical protein
VPLLLKSRKATTVSGPALVPGSVITALPSGPTVAVSGVGVAFTPVIA